ncbi:MAG: ATP-binding protein [Nocardioidaceae bacterium]
MGTSTVRAGHAPVVLRVPFAPGSVSVARQRLRSWLIDQGSGNDVIEDARVVVSELVANSVRHARPLQDGNLLVSWSVEQRGLQISVSDGGAVTRPRAVHAGSSALAGRGMTIVEALTKKWWSERSETRATVHTLLAL